MKHRAYHPADPNYDPEPETAYDERAEERARMREERIEREAEEHNQGV